jgi:hypothetical protein
MIWQVFVEEDLGDGGWTLRTDTDDKVATEGERILDNTCERKEHNTATARTEVKNKLEVDMIQYTGLTRGLTTIRCISSEVMPTSPSPRSTSRSSPRRLQSFVYPKTSGSSFVPVNVS